MTVIIARTHPVRPVYLTASLAPSNQYLFKLADPKYAYTVRDALEGKIVGGGRPLRARFIESSEATKMCQMRVADITLSAPSIRRPNRAAILGETTPSPAGRNTETIDRGWLPMDRSHYGAFVEAIIAQSPGRVALLRGVPYTLSPDILMRRLQRAYKLADPSESRLRWFDERRREWTQVEVEPVMRIHTSSNRFQQVDGSPRDGAAVYLVRFANALDAQRLYRRFHRKIWDQSSRSFSFGAHTRRMAERNHARRQHGDEASAKEESGESAEPYFDPWEQDEGLFRPPGQSERDATGDEDGQLVAPPSRLQPGEVGMDHRRFSIDVQIMY